MRDPTVRTTALALGAALLTTACRDPAPVPPPPPRVSVARPIADEILEWDEYTARLEAIETVEVRARVGGYLQSIHFTDGATVTKGDLLFTIDPRPYQAVLGRSEAEMGVAKARLDLARTRFARASRLVERNAISREEADTRAAEARQSEATVTAAAAAVEAARLDVEFTQVRAPITGRTSRRLVTEGNLVNGGVGTQATLLTTIVSLDPVYAYFDADERTYLRYTRLGKKGERPSSRDVQNPVWIGLADEDGYPHQGYMDFVDNQIDEGTGTMVGRAVIPNPDLLLVPGLFARLRLPGSGAIDALLLPDEAVLSDQAEKFVWVVGDDDIAQYRRIQIGRLHEGMRIVQDGLAPSDRVVVAGVQRVRPGIQVAAEEVAIGADGRVVARPAPDAGGP